MTKAVLEAEGEGEGLKERWGSLRRIEAAMEQKGGSQD